MNKIKLLLFIIFFSNIFLNAQNLASKHPFWLSTGFGGDEEYLNSNISFNKAFDNFSYLISLNGIIETQYLFSGRGMTTGMVGLGLSDIEVWKIVSIYAGPSVSIGKGSTSPGESRHFWGAGFSLTGQVYFMPFYKLFPGLGIGLELFYNYNAVQTERVNFRNVYVIRLSAIITDLHELINE